jgi:hypothetical protein
MPGMYTDEEYVAAVDRVWIEAEAVLGCPLRSNLPVNKVVDLLRYSDERTDLYAKNLTADEAAWKLLYTQTKEVLGATDPKLVAAIESNERKVHSLKVVGKALKARQKADLSDWGFRVPLGFLIVGALIGFFRSPDLVSVAVGGVMSWLAGLLFSIFVLDSADLQISFGMRLLGKPGLTRLGVWLVSRPLKRFAPEENAPKPPPLPK